MESTQEFLVACEATPGACSAAQTHCDFGIQMSSGNSFTELHPRLILPCGNSTRSGAHSDLLESLSLPATHRTTAQFSGISLRAAGQRQPPERDFE